jgi:hypothetical protein
MLNGSQSPKEVAPRRLFRRTSSEILGKTFLWFPLPHCPLTGHFLE